MSHDGCFSPFGGFLVSAEVRAYPSTRKSGIVAFKFGFDSGTAPAVGVTLTLKSSNITKPSVQSVWGTLQSQAGAGKIDLIG